MNKDNLPGFQVCGQLHGLLEGIESCSGDMSGWVLETVLQPLFKYTRLDNQEVGMLHFIPILWEGLEMEKTALPVEIDDRTMQPPEPKSVQLIY
jgi:hypothetical protein